MTEHSVYTRERKAGREAPAVGGTDVGLGV